MQKSKRITFFYVRDLSQITLKITFWRSLLIISKQKIDTTQNSEYRLRSVTDKTVSQIIIESSQLAQKDYKTWQNRLEKVICWKLYKRLKFDQTKK